MTTMQQHVDGDVTGTLAMNQTGTLAMNQLRRTAGASTSGGFRARARGNLRQQLGLVALLTGLLGFLPSAANAQALIVLLLGDYIVGPNFQPGLNVSFVGSGFWGLNDDIRLGVGVSIYGEVRLSKRLSVQPEFQMKTPGGARHMSTHIPAYPFTEPSGEPTLDELTSSGEVTRELKYIAFPVVVKYRVGPIGLGLGPQVGILVDAKDVVSGKPNGKDLTQTGNIESDLTGYDIGLVGSVELAFDQKDPLRSMKVRLKGVAGLVDTLKDNPGDPVRNWTLFFGLDIPIGSDKAPPIPDNMK
jgi:Outer membrane protein beta-barrel domain